MPRARDVHGSPARNQVSSEGSPVGELRPVRSGPTWRPSAKRAVPDCETPLPLPSALPSKRYPSRPCRIAIRRNDSSRRRGFSFASSLKRTSTLSISSSIDFPPNTAASHGIRSTAVIDREVGQRDRLREDPPILAFDGQRSWPTRRCIAARAVPFASRRPHQVDARSRVRGVASAPTSSITSSTSARQRLRHLNCMLIWISSRRGSSARRPRFKSYVLPKYGTDRMAISTT